VGHFERKFQGEGGHPPTIYGVKNRLPALSRGVVCVILCLAVLIQYRRVTHTQTDRQTHGHTMMAITRASLWRRAGKNLRSK